MSSQSAPSPHEMAYGRIEKQPDGLIHLYLHDNLNINLALAQQMVADVRAIAQSEQIRLLLVYGKNSDISFRAQRYFATVTGFTHLAFVVSNRVQAEIGQFLVSLLQTLRSTYEFKLFYEVETALIWLRQ